MFNFKLYTSYFQQFNRLALMCLLLLLPMHMTHASFYKTLWPQWLVNNPLSKKTISHQLWQNFLDRYVIVNEEQINLVDYAHITPEDYKNLKRYLDELAQVDINSYNRQEQLAYWINLYNALTVYTVADYYPVTSIQEIRISPGLFSIGPWGANLVTVRGTPISLDDINNRIIRPIWNDPRTQYALNNATIGAPNLSKKAYEGKTLEVQLNDATFNYINSLRGVEIIEGKLVISKLYEWYEEDFGGTKQDVLYHLSQFAKKRLMSQLKHINSIDSYVYNWHINSPPSSQ